MIDIAKGRFRIIEQEEGMFFTFSGLQLVNVLSIPFMVIDVMLILILSLIFYGLYYAPIAYKLIVVAFSFPFVGFWLFTDFFLVWHFTRKSTIKINSEQIEIESNHYFLFIKFTNKPNKIIKNEDIISIKNQQSNMPTSNHPEYMYPGVFIITKEEEYNLLAPLGFFPINREATWMVNKIADYLDKDIVTIQ